MKRALEIIWWPLLVVSIAVAVIESSIGLAITIVGLGIIKIGQRQV